MLNNQLILYSTTLNAPLPTIPQLINTLQTLQFIAQPYSSLQQLNYQVGEQFLNLITFLGCSPVIHTDPTHSDPATLCYLTLYPPFQTPLFLKSPHLKHFRCPHCRHSSQHWSSLLQAWEQDKLHFHYTCPHCQTTLPPQQLNWRHQAAFTRLILLIHNLYEGEAVPNDSLMTQLKQHTHNDWDYFYTQHLSTQLPNPPFTE